MGFCSALTLVLIVLKLIGVITWSWFFVLLPAILIGLFYLFCVICAIITFK